ncbi:type II toxin-antitoxin system RelB/DinJ family antitoxin [Patescibacteria group bacterium]|nr:type II toxin-antitoxin system RelB/DinJ family antitoxin [Patescibacteria group bacterium]MCL5010126.1 type II toxin-antitoxin system RelB/DinJ family antitoxin [Patescibacteria group bacterium]
MNYAVVTTKIDPQTKKQAMATAEELGMPLSVIIKGFLKQFIRTKTITFSAQEEEIPSEYFKQTLAKARKNWEEGKGSPVFHTPEEAVKWLDEQGI